MDEKAEKIVQKVETLLLDQCAPQRVSKEVYGAVLGELRGRIEGLIDAVREEEGDDWYEEHVMGWK
jgi:hypothetical protein